jgi:glucose-1-phosphate cytidylyltransferase
MKAVILAGGLGTRFSEETHNKPKPMIEIGGVPICVHIMNIYADYGIKDFIICMGYKKEVIVDYFTNYNARSSKVIEVNLKSGEVKKSQYQSKDWNVTLVDTGELTMIGGRIKRILPLVQNEPYFYLTYGDGLSDINISKLTQNHIESDKRVTLTGVQPEGRFGALELQGDKVINFAEKPIGDGGWINGGYFVINPSKIEDLIEGDETVWEQEPLQMLASTGELNCYKHSGFWKPMDTLRDKVKLEEMWDSGKAPWGVNK